MISQRLFQKKTCFVSCTIKLGKGCHKSGTSCIFCDRYRSLAQKFFFQLEVFIISNSTLLLLWSSFILPQSRECLFIYLDCLFFTLNSSVKCSTGYMFLIAGDALIGKGSNLLTLHFNSFLYDTLRLPNDIKISN